MIEYGDYLLISYDVDSYFNDDINRNVIAQYITSIYDGYNNNVKMLLYILYLNEDWWLESIIKNKDYKSFDIHNFKYMIHFKNYSDLVAYLI